MIKTKIIFTVFAASSLISLFIYASHKYNLPYVSSVLRHIAGPFFAEKITPEHILANYEKDKIKILIVPGHDLNFYGTQFKGVTEAQINAELGQELFDFFKKDDRFDVYTTRLKDGNYTEWFNDYLELNHDQIKNFITDSKKQWRAAVDQGMPLKNQVEHNYAPTDTAIKLYAINKWANENDVEIVFHIHFNDYPGRNINQEGEYSGFSVYVPEYQLPNHRSSSELAKSIKNQLEKYFPKSSLPAEYSTLIEDQELIAIGSNASRDGISVLMEYGYIYEPQFANEGTKKIIFKELAYQTYVGIKKFFDKNISPINKHETTLLPYKWNNLLSKGMEGLEDIIRLQMALHQEELYPPSPKNFEECPINGVFRSCTYKAVKSFQEKYADEILTANAKTEEATGFVGPNTLKKLNELYGK